MKTIFKTLVIFMITLSTVFGYSMDDYNHDISIAVGNNDVVKVKQIIDKAVNNGVFDAYQGHLFYKSISESIKNYNLAKNIKKREGLKDSNSKKIEKEIKRLKTIINNFNTNSSYRMNYSGPDIHDLEVKIKKLEAELNGIQTSQDSYTKTEAKYSSNLSNESNDSNDNTTVKTPDISDDKGVFEVNKYVALLSSSEKKAFIKTREKLAKIIAKKIAPGLLKMKDIQRYKTIDKINSKIDVLLAKEKKNFKKAVLEEVIIQLTVLRTK